MVLAREGAVAGVDVRGGGPGSREIALLDPVNHVAEVHAVVLSGGSAFGLDAASGVVRWLEEHGHGYRAGPFLVPIVPASILFDLGLEGEGRVRPGPECGYAAAEAAAAAGPGAPVAEGSVGAGAGATVGKIRGLGHLMKGGFGTWSTELPGGLVVAAAAAVNAIGDVVDPATGRVVAGALADDGRTFADARTLLRTHPPRLTRVPPLNTTLGVVATNARLTKVEATKVARMAQDGLARTIYPAHTTRDGDTVYALATGRLDGPADVSWIGAIAAEVLAEAVMRGVREAEGLPGIPSVRDLAARRA